MKNKRLLIVVIIALLLIFLIFKLFIGGKKYSFNIENASNISKIVIEKNNGSSKVELINNDIVKYTIDSINGEKRTTKKSSKEDIPEVDEYYTISFEGTEQKIYVYTNPASPLNNPLSPSYSAFCNKSSVYSNNVLVIALSISLYFAFLKYLFMAAK